MSRLIDIVRARRFEEWFDIDDDCQKVFANMVDDYPDVPPPTVILADNVRDWYVEAYRNGEKIGAHKNLMDDLWNLAPPFERFWIEYSAPDNGKYGVYKIGVGFLATELPEHYRVPSTTTRLLKSTFHRSAVSTTGLGKVVSDEEEWMQRQKLDLSRNPRWFLEALTFTSLVGSTKDMANGPMLKTVLIVADDGRLCSLPLVMHKLMRSGATYNANDVATAFAIMTRPALMAITFTHAKNVELTPGEPIPRKLQEKRKRSGKRPLLPYQVIDIHPVKRAALEVAASESVSEGEAVRRLRVRGHFKDYRQRGLFGKHKAVYFWHEVDNTEPHGIERRDYKVNTK